MSLAKCIFCDGVVNTDRDPDSGYIVPDKFVCFWCRDQRGLEPDWNINDEPDAYYGTDI